jgi:hypothetical protein
VKSLEPYFLSIKVGHDSGRLKEKQEFKSALRNFPDMLAILPLSGNREACFGRTGIDHLVQGLGNKGLD